MTIGSLGSLLPLPDALLPPEFLLLSDRTKFPVARSRRATILIVILLEIELSPADTDPAAPPVGLVSAPSADLLLRELLDLDPPKLAKRLVKLETPCLLLPPGLLPADAALALPAETGLALAAPLALVTPDDSLSAISEAVNPTDNGGDETISRGIEERSPPVPSEEDPLLELLPGALENLTLAVREGLLSRPPADAPFPLAAPLPLAAAAALPPLPPTARSSGKNISMTPTIPPLAGRIMRIAGRPSSLVPKVTCPVPR
mmetsp:Transcript_15634/g.28245  ORF Transcript_15634/g.28245 Transcript_15634/m.28245 type:complete len:260 (+) Transcript_15634:2481-3260(+)|eukprot:CAMPEP_0201628592 /NCGR_PEP_ID=MMETSP0493-20130528/3502_1 /ASSEMBLY_ACC=CAM_ASM_000838 /TAXON_ID=420259 /ORGANISM="Thalassiosira gravida, Strain GMp14c1" /LENGTH=259 /DNA_ID=CAMNT_0048099389 /DNA_START=2543 /DNA_END=3322 /DNA_ORIENTATION=-